MTRCFFNQGLLGQAWGFSCLQICMHVGIYMDVCTHNNSVQGVLSDKFLLHVGGALVAAFALLCPPES